MNDKDISVEETERRVLSSATEDYFGLYEIIWELNAAYPTASLGAKYTAAESAVRNLLNKGWIALYRRQGGWDGNGGETETYEPVSPDAVEVVISNPTGWYPEYAGECVTFLATDEGEKVYFSR